MLLKVSKHNEVLGIKYSIQLEYNWSNIKTKKADLTFEFINGVSIDSNVNELFSMMSLMFNEENNLIVDSSTKPNVFTGLFAINFRQTPVCISSQRISF